MLKCIVCKTKALRHPFMLRSSFVRKDGVIMDEVPLCSYRCIIQYAIKMAILKTKESVVKLTLTGLQNGKTKQTRSK